MNKYFEIKWELTNIKEHETWLKKYINRKNIIEIIAENEKQAIDRTKFTLKENWGSCSYIIYENSLQEIKLDERFTNVNFEDIKNKYNGYYQVFEKNNYIYGCNNLKEAINYMNNRCNNDSWIYDSNDEPYNYSFLYGYELN